jgi:mono/diheme cytochrome c family protein
MISRNRTDSGTSANLALRVFGIVFAAALLMAAADTSWMKNVPESVRRRVNPYSGMADAVAAGARLFADHCAKCHGADALGKKTRPSLRTDRVQHAQDGELFWVLKNGGIAHGMPSWSVIPEPSRWQIIAYVKSLGVSQENHSNVVPLQGEDR